MDRRDDPVLTHARREALVIGLAWLASLAYCCGSAYAFGYRRPGRPLGPEDIRPILGMPFWVFWGVLVPWAASALFTVWFAGRFMADDDLGKDRAEELNEAIREGGLDG